MALIQKIIQSALGDDAQSDSKAPKGYQPTSADEEDTDTRIEVNVNQKEFFETPKEEEVTRASENGDMKTDKEDPDIDKEDQFEKVAIKKKLDKKITKTKKLKEKRDKTDME